MTAKLSPDSIGLIFTMNAAGHGAEEISAAAGCSYSTVVRYLNQAGVVLGNKGRPRECTDNYIAMAKDMAAQGYVWVEIERRLGFHRSTIHNHLRAQRTQQ